MVHQRGFKRVVRCGLEHPLELRDALRIGTAHHSSDPGSLNGFARAWHRCHRRLSAFATTLTASPAHPT